MASSKLGTSRIRSHSAVYYLLINNNTVVSSQISTSYLCSAVYSLLVNNPSRPCLTPECRVHPNQTRSLSYSYISPNQTCLPHMLTFNPAPQTPDFLRSILHVGDLQSANLQSQPSKWGYWCITHRSSAAPTIVLLLFSY